MRQRQEVQAVPRQDRVMPKAARFRARRVVLYAACC
ncbi:hypothetical protein LJR223_003270 [Paraburkholderia terricola]